MSNVIAVNFPNNFDRPLTLENVHKDFWAYEGATFLQNCKELGHEDHTAEYQIFLIQEVYDHVYYSGLYDDYDSKEAILEELERLELWWEVQGVRMHEGLSYITEA